MPYRLKTAKVPNPFQHPASSPFGPCSEYRQTASRLFSTSPRNGTQLRRAMFRWLQGPGAAFRDPLPGSTNYLSAYNKDGHLIRSRQDPGDDSGGGPTGQKQASGRDEPLPEESEQDLRPFPMNPDFRSQPVLDESLREEIYNRVMQDGKPVKVVSAELGVEMNRVGAVVRLKEIEKRWILEVRFTIVLRTMPVLLLLL